MAFTLKKGAKAPTKEFFEKAFKDQRMKFESMAKESRKLPRKAYALGIKPVT